MKKYKIIVEIILLILIFNFISPIVHATEFEDIPTNIIDDSTQDVNTNTESSGSTTNEIIDQNADNQTEIEFGNEELETYILENHDIDNDGKITAFDMAQIQELYISSFGIENTKGLEYATNLKFLYIYIRYENYGETIKYDFSHLNSLTNLKELYNT